MSVCANLTTSPHLFGIFLYSSLELRWQQVSNESVCASYRIRRCLHLYTQPYIPLATQPYILCMTISHPSPFWHWTERSLKKHLVRSPAAHLLSKCVSARHFMRCCDAKPRPNKRYTTRYNTADHLEGHSTWRVCRAQKVRVR